MFGQLCPYELIRCVLLSLPSAIRLVKELFGIMGCCVLVEPLRKCWHRKCSSAMAAVRIFFAVEGEKPNARDHDTVGSGSSAKNPS